MKRTLILMGMAALLAVPTADVAQFRYQITRCEPDAFTLNGGLAGHVLTARIAGGFTIEQEPGATTASLVDFALTLADPISHSPAVNAAEYDGKPLQELLPVDMEGLPGRVVGPPLNPGLWFGITFADMPDVPWASMAVNEVGNEFRVQLAANLYGGVVYDGGALIFKPVAAAIVPEPAAASLLVGACAGLIIMRYRR